MPLFGSFYLPRRLVFQVSFHKMYIGNSPYNFHHMHHHDTHIVDYVHDVRGVHVLHESSVDAEAHPFYDHLLLYMQRKAIIKIALQELL